MNSTTRMSSAHENRPLVIAALTAMLIGAAAQEARAGHFGSADDRVKQVFCDMTAIKGGDTNTESRYSASGMCTELESPQKIDSARDNVSEFPRINESKEIWRAQWTAQGTYNPVTKETWERITMPAPTIDQKTPVGRPYGNYETRMICATDPWLTGISAACTGKTVNATGNLGSAEAALRKLNRPASTPNKAPQLQALQAAHDRYVKTHSFASTTETTGKGRAMAQLFAPTIIEPKAGSTHAPQTPLRIRVAAANNAKDTAYELEIQVQANFDWRVLTSIPTNAAVAQSTLGYQGWGGHVAGTGAQMMAIVGSYRVRARATSPSRSEPGDWVEFKIDGPPGISIQDAARSTGEKVGSAPPALRALKSGAMAGTTEASHAATPYGSAVAPKAATAALLKTQQSPLNTVKNKTDAVLLNPQPLPPSALPTQAPSAFR